MIIRCKLLFRCLSVCRRLSFHSEHIQSQSQYHSHAIYPQTLPQEYSQSPQEWKVPQNRHTFHQPQQPLHNAHPPKAHSTPYPYLPRSSKPELTQSQEHHDSQILLDHTYSYQNDVQHSTQPQWVPLSSRRLKFLTLHQSASFQPITSSDIRGRRIGGLPAWLMGRRCRLLIDVHRVNLSMILLLFQWLG